MTYMIEVLRQEHRSIEKLLRVLERELSVFDRGDRAASALPREKIAACLWAESSTKVQYSQARRGLYAVRS
jgi:hypothetical protein